VRTFADTLQGVSIYAVRKGLRDVGVKDNEVLIFSELMDAKSLFLTANCDTVYLIGGFDLSKGPLVLEVPPQVLGTVQDAWFRWVIDLGLPGPDRGLGGKYLIVPPDYEGTLPEGEFNIAHSRTIHGVWFARAFLENGNDPKPTVERLRKYTRIYPYNPGGVGTPIAEFLAGKAKLGPITDPAPTVFHEGSGKVMNTIPPNDWSYYEMLNEVVQQEPATALDPELMGPIAAIGIVKGKPFAPDARMKKILTEALKVANATSRTLFMSPRDRSWYYYTDANWQNMLFATGYEFETPIPMITKEGVKPFPTTGYRQLDARQAFFYGVTGITPAMAMRLTGIGSTYLWTMVDAQNNYFDGSQDLQGYTAKEHSRREILVLHAVRHDAPIDARHAATLSARRQPELSITGSPGGRRWLDDDIFLTGPTGRCAARQLDPDHPRQEFYSSAAPVQSARVVL
jgi:hypothetical protein